MTTVKTKTDERKLYEFIVESSWKGVGVERNFLITKSAAWSFTDQRLVSRSFAMLMGPGGIVRSLRNQGFRVKTRCYGRVDYETRLAIQPLMRQLVKEYEERVIFPYMYLWTSVCRTKYPDIGHDDLEIELNDIMSELWRAFRFFGQKADWIAASEFGQKLIKARGPYSVILHINEQIKDILLGILRLPWSRKHYNVIDETDAYFSLVSAGLDGLQIPLLPPDNILVATDGGFLTLPEETKEAVLDAVRWLKTEAFNILSDKNFDWYLYFTNILALDYRRVFVLGEASFFWSHDAGKVQPASSAKDVVKAFLAFIGRCLRYDNYIPWHRRVQIMKKIEEKLATL